MKALDMRNGILAVAAVGLLSLPVQASQSTLNDNPLLKQLQQTEAKAVRTFRGEKPWSVASVAEQNSRRSLKRQMAVDEPATSFEGLGNFDYLDGPDGTSWFYVAEYEIESEVVSEWYTEERILGYTFTIYDSSFQEIGKIKDKVHLAEGESKVAHAVLDPAVSRRFYNDDANPEVMVYLAMNTSADFGYEVHYYNKVYSVGGEKDTDGNDVCLITMPGRCVDTFNGGTDSNENFFYSFVEEVYPDPSDFDFNDFLGYINAAKNVITVFGKGEDGTPRELFKKEIFMTRVPGDTTDGIYMITRNENGVPYFIFSYYEKPYFIDPTGFATDESATPDNSLVIEACTYAGGSLNTISTTRIPVEIPAATDQVNYVFYSIGSMTWKDDVDMSVNGTPQAPAYLVALDQTTAANLDDVTSSYVMYSNDGKQIHLISEGADGFSLLSSAPGEEPHALFVYFEGEENYLFRLVDLYSGKEYFNLDRNFNEDPLTASCQRMKGADGKYNYVFEMQYDDLDDNFNEMKRLAWFTQEGEFSHIDYINMGRDVMYASVNLYPECLTPTLYDDDPAMEYAVLVKRFNGSTTRNEFLVVDDNGEWYAHFSEDDGKGMPMMFTILPGVDKNRLEMIYSDNDGYNIDIYDLPFTLSSGVDDIVADAAGAEASFNGSEVMMPGAVKIEVYNAGGVKVAEGKTAVSLSNLPKGIYLAVGRDGAGKLVTLKVAI